MVDRPAAHSIFHLLSSHTHTPMPAYLAFDLGASGSRAVLGRLGGDVMRMEEIHRFATPIIEEGDHLFWDLDALWNELQAGLQQALDAAPNLRALSVDSWGVDYVPLDAQGAPLRRPYCYRDPRTNGVMQRAFETLPAEALYARTGIQFLPFNTLYQVLADQAQDARALRRVHRHLTLADYFNYRFSGKAVVEVSMASTTQMMDVHTRQWSEPLLRAFGLDVRQWPPIVPSGTCLGALNVAPSESRQPTADVAVVASCSHDTGSAVAATPATQLKGGWAYLSCGTWSILGVERTVPLLTTAAREAGFTHEAGLDGTIRFLKNLTGLWPLQECARTWGVADWPALEREARAAPSNRARIDLEDPRFVARGGMEARLRAYCREHEQPVPETRGQLVRLLLESLAESYRRALHDLGRLTGQALSTIHLFGGGSQNRLLCQLTADACAVTVVAGPTEATALGNLLIQARTMGDLPEGLTLREVAARSCAPEVYTPTVQPA